MDVFEAAKKVEEHILASINSTTTVQTSGTVAIKGGNILHFKSENEAINLVAGSGWVFKYLYRNGQVEITPIGS